MNYKPTQDNRITHVQTQEVLKTLGLKDLHLPEEMPRSSSSHSPFLSGSSLSPPCLLVCVCVGGVRREGDSCVSMVNTPSSFILLSHFNCVC